jgi:hypothetical protein
MDGGDPARGRDHRFEVGARRHARIIARAGLVRQMRLERLVNKYEEKSPAPAPSGRTDVQSKSRAVIGAAIAAETIELLRRRRHRVTKGYRYTFLVLAGAMAITGVALASDTTNAWWIALDHVGVALTVGSVVQVFLHFLEEGRSQAEYRLENLRNQLELLSSVYNMNQAPEPQLYERTLKLLDEAQIE